MSVKRLAAFLALALCIMAAIPMDVSDADISHHAECGNVTVMTFDISMELDAGGETPITIYVTNNNSYPVSVEIKETDGSDVNVSADGGIFTVAKNTTVSIPATLSTDKYTAQGDYKVLMKMIVVDNMGVRTETGDDGLTIDVKVLSKYSSSGQFNKILGIFENTLPAPFDSVASATLISAIGWLIIALAVSIASYYLVKHIFRKLSREERTGLAKKISISALIITIFYGLIVCLHVAGIDTKTMSSNIILSNVVYSIAGAYIVWCLYKGFVKLILLRNEDDDDANDIDTSFVPLFNFVGEITIVVFTVGFVLYSLGFNVASIIAGAGIAGIGVSLGAKPAINEFFAGITLIITHPFKIGEYIKIGSYEPLIVKRIGILKTQLVTSYTTDIISVPNSVIMSSTIKNYSCENKKYRNTLDIRVPYDTNVQLAKKILKTAAAEHPNVVMDGSVPKPTVMFYSQTDRNSITLRLAYYVKDYDVNGSTAGKIRESIATKFRENNIKQPYIAREFNLFEKEGADNA